MAILLVLLSILSGFFLAGIPGALLFGTFNTLAWKSLRRKETSTGALLFGFAGFSALGYLLMLGFGLLGATENAQKRVDAIRTNLEQDGYSPRWFIISQKRTWIYNKLLLNSVDKSKHMQGKAIDLYIIDIDGDGDYDKGDYTLIEKAAANVNRTSPELSGKTYSYLGKGFFSRCMVHVELK